MRNWSTDTTELEKNPEQYAIWKLEQMVNFGLQGEKLNRQLLEKYWDKIVIDSSRRKYLRHILDVS
ncbi:MAG: hypothetical protein A2920_01785 [Candidatus Zambryskibacteria bacterium RIFCSPLOWO2_01_FULL_43_17]|uniref:Uncharacterized protein n=1 Tax=Candidatus Zambryskibacteria bacterium RIFCSPLOWO2_01_FULL_43_17 TaxID=1802760 RepID=A0A1G2U3Q3_9BACT|nr:MAG: hypothetical protein A2920_01785 [Candidatus Zambryskibacteria bacterium RIFCSPLOWO2_01_FULL_43_17]